MPRGVTQVDMALRQNRLWTPFEQRPAVMDWIDFSTESDFDVATGISVVASRAGTARLMVQATTGAQPAYAIGGLNGRAAASFDGSDDRLTSQAGIARTQQWSAFAVFKSTNVGVTGSVWDGDVTSAGSRHGQYIVHQSATLASIAFNTSNAAFTATGPTAVAANVPMLAASVRGASSVQVWTNGSPGTATTTTGTPSSPTISLTMGAVSSGGGSQWFPGTVGEAILMNVAATPQVRQLIEGYLAWKWWGESNPLIASHPFKNRPPLIGD